MEGKGPVVDRQEHADVRLGLSSKSLGIWDNGFYVEGSIGGKVVTFLVDSGSTAKLHQSLQTKDFPLSAVSRSLRDVNGNNLTIHGSMDLGIKLKEDTYMIPALVCDISQDAILGQDFLLRYVHKIDFQNLQISIGNDTIDCWTGGQAAMVCRVHVSEAVTIPACSQMMIPVDIPNAHRLSNTALMEPSIKLMEKKGITLTPGVIDSKSNCHAANIVNYCNEEIKLYPNTNLGTCRSLVEEIQETQRCAIIKEPEKDGKEFPKHLEDLFCRSSGHLTEVEKEELKDLLWQYQDVFSKNNQDIGRTHRVEHRIETGNAAPIRTQPRRLPIGKKKTEQEEVQKMLDNGIIEPSRSAWSSAIVLVPKKDGSTRFCVDYRKLNDVTIKDAYPLPRVDDCLDALANSKWFSSMDLNSGFWQIGMAEEHKEKTAFSTSLGLFHFKVMPFGLCNSPSTLSRLLEDVLRGLQ